MQDGDKTTHTAGSILKDLGKQIGTSLVCLAAVGAVLWGWHQLKGGPVGSIGTAMGSSLAGGDTVSIELGVSRMVDGMHGCKVGFRLENTGRTLGTQISTKIEARASDGSAIGGAVVLGSNIRAGGSGIDEANFSNVACAEIASIFVAPRYGFEFGSSSKSLVRIEM